jgi:hypothetical protein
MAETFRVAFALSVPLALLSACSSSEDTGSPAASGGSGAGHGPSIAGAGVGPGPSAGWSSGGAAGNAGGALSAAGSSGASAIIGGGGSGGKGSVLPAPGKPGEVGGCKMFPESDAWNLDISGVPAHAALTKKVQDLVGNAKLHPDYGVDGQQLYGIPINVVPSTQPAVPVSFDGYPDESDPGPYPFPSPDAVIIEGNRPESCEGDCHLLVVQQGSCTLYEGYACEHRLDGWHCANGAKWNLNEIGYGQRPQGWTSADAAGLAIAPGLLRYDEVRAGEVTHALRFTLDCTSNEYVQPATHKAVPGGCDPNDGPPMGTRVRLKADYDISKLSPSAQVVLRGMKKYGMILADNGSNFYFQGQANSGWTRDDIEPLKGVPASAFEVVDMPPLKP